MENNNESLCQCSRCDRTFIRKWIAPKKKFSQIHSVDYWTEGKGWNSYKFLCKHCLKDWFEKEKDIFISLVSPKRKRIFYNYYNLGLFDKTHGESFVSKWNKK